MLTNTETLYLLLQKIKGVSFKSIKHLIDSGSKIKNLMNGSFDEMVAKGVPIPIAVSLEDEEFKSVIEKTNAQIESLKKESIHLISYEHEKYPTLLKQIAYPPGLIFAKGNIDCLNNLCIALVGSRKVSSQGDTLAFNFALQLAEKGITVVSGLAYGVDIRAHLGALRGKGSTVAVLGSGLKCIYPGKHAQYINEICQNGCVITEYPPSEPPNSYNFPKRNRIISGISTATVVIEASARSGSLITARIAKEQQRDLFAVPAFPSSFNNATNELIKNGATIVTEAKDIIDKYLTLDNEKKYQKNKQSTQKKDTLNSNKNIVMDLLATQPLSLEEIIQKANDKYTYDEVYSEIVDLELDNMIEKGSDNKYYLVLN